MRTMTKTSIQTIKSSYYKCIYQTHVCAKDDNEHELSLNLTD